MWSLVKNDQANDQAIVNAYSVNDRRLNTITLGRFSAPLLVLRYSTLPSKRRNHLDTFGIVALGQIPVPRFHSLTQ